MDKPEPLMTAMSEQTRIAHTPGPWSAHFEEAYFVTGPDLGRVAMMTHLKGAHGLGGRRSGDESAANCRLIAAAPDLLEALKALLFTADDSPSYDDAIVQARAAIAKATGAATRRAIVRAAAELGAKT